MNEIGISFQNRINNFNTLEPNQNTRTFAFLSDEEWDTIQSDFKVEIRLDIRKCANTILRYLSEEKFGLSNKATDSEKYMGIRSLGIFCRELEFHKLQQIFKTVTEKFVDYDFDLEKLTALIKTIEEADLKARQNSLEKKGSKRKLELQEDDQLRKLYEVCREEKN